MCWCRGAGMCFNALWHWGPGLGGLLRPADSSSCPLGRGQAAPPVNGSCPPVLCRLNSICGTVLAVPAPTCVPPGVGLIRVVDQIQQRDHVPHAGPVGAPGQPKRPAVDLRQGAWTGSRSNLALGAAQNAMCGSDDAAEDAGLTSSCWALPDPGTALLCCARLQQRHPPGRRRA